MRRDLVISTALVAVTAAAYWQAACLGLVAFDDLDYVSENAHVLGGLTWQGAAWAFTTPEQCNWHPVTWLSHMADVELFGTWSGGYHLASLALHCANTVLLFLILRWMTGAAWRSAAVAALFAVHPLHVESVAWVAERKDVLSAFLGLLALIAYVWYVRRPGVGRYVAVFVLLALGLMAKPMLVTLPLVFLLLDWWPLGRLAKKGSAAAPDAPTAPAAAAQEASRRRVALRLVLEKAPLLALSAASSVITYVVQQRGGATVKLEWIPPGLRVENAVLSYVGYLGKMLWPADLAVYYPYVRSPSLASVLAAAGLLAAISAAVAWGARRGRQYLAVGWLWYLGMLVPVIGLVQVGGQAMADRYTYLPLVGMFIMAVWGAADLAANWRHGQKALAPAAACVVLALAAATARQVTYWTDSAALFEHAAAATADNSFAHYNAGAALMRLGRTREAVEHYREAIRIDPVHVKARNNLGVFLADHGRTDEAIAHFRVAIRLRPDDPELHYNLGRSLAAQGRTQEAVAHYREAIRLKPDYVDAHNNLGNALAREGRTEEAIEHYRQALRIRPDYAIVHNNLANALADRGLNQEAAAQCREAVRLEPRSAEARNNLAAALAACGRTDEAVAQYREAIRLKPELPEPYRNLAWIHAAHPDPKFRSAAEAVALAERACELTGRRDPDALDALASAYAEAGRFPEAAAVARQAADLAAATGQADLAADIQTRLRLYESGQPYRSPARP
jgi:Flp pilus assembly protein TadD